MRRSVVCAVLTLLVSLPATAQSIQSPSEFLGYELGTRFSRHHQVVDYFRHVAEASGRVTLQPYGETYEGRPLMVAFVGTPDRIASLDRIRTDNLRLTGLETGEAEGDTPAIVWLSYNVHGNESVSTEAAMATLYELARPGGRGEAWLENTLVVIDPCINPDGRDRYVNWYNETVGFRANANPDAREHFEPWPGGRTNHYHFDLNRDWAWQTQKESQERIALFNQWLPHVHVDFHEQGVNSPYYFAPAAEPFHDAITPWQRALQDSIGTNHARYFDAEGWLYFTREVFDLFYPGYGDTYPTFNGGIGMTYEQGGSGRAGLAIETAEGDTLTLGDRIAHHHTTGLSTVETTSRHAERVVREFEAFYDRDPDGRFRSYIIKASSGGDRLAALADHLDRLGIRYGTVSAATRPFDAVGYRSGTAVSGRAEPGDLVISAEQPKSVLTRVLMEPEASLPDSLTYDITAWALPYAYGTDALATTSSVRPDAAFVRRSARNAQASGAYAWALRWDDPTDLHFLSSALGAGINARVAVEPFSVRDLDFAAGTVLFTRAGNEEEFEDELLALAAASGTELIALRGGRVERGSDFGAGSVRFISAPRIAIATDSPVSSYAAGEIWHWFEQVLRYPVTMVSAERLGSLDLDDYDVLVLPSGSYGGVLNDRTASDLRSWISAGGRVVALERAASSLAGRDGFSIKERSEDEDEDDSDDEADRLRAYGDRDRASLTDDLPGAIFRTRVDATHPLGFGLGRGYYTLRRGTPEFSYLEDGWNVGVIEAGSRLSGHVGSEAGPKVDDTLAFGVEEIGRGAVVYLVDDPIYRGFWYEGQLLLGNAIFMPLR